MISTWRRRKAGKNHRPSDLEVTIPTHFRCPISLDLMKDPVTLSTGITYDRENIEAWIDAGNYTCPVTSQALRSVELIPNHAIRKMIQDWCVENRSYGIERIPTPRVPVTAIEVMEILSDIMDATRREDESKCKDLVMNLQVKGKESERNKNCIRANGAGGTLAAVFNAFAVAVSSEKHMGVLEVILSALTLMFPLDAEAGSSLGSPDSLRCMVWFLKSGDLSARRNAVLAMKEILSLDNEYVCVLERIEGGKEALLKLIKVPICPTSTNASLMVIYYMVSSSSSSSSSSLTLTGIDKIRSEFADMGLVSLLVEEILVDSEKSLCEKALGVLDGICNSEEARQKAYNHALTIPVIVKKILRVSDMATEFSVSIIWKLCKNEKRDDGGVLVEALQVGAFQKLLLLLQVGCGEKTKEKASEVLKLLNLNRDKCECIDSMDLKEIKRPF
ncbi:U-box domain-containing protein 21-like [Telopea speciosissima]|uniref:U-box domain-containing protein 21-like n=1 Tax=Telopea speciosissima TaxID=54955 RepID=UPI001CC759E3|nr:U-box domain-containing protein 21-like [Telopea speciosissima]